MAVDFTVSMEFDDAGIPHIVTDYPFDATGATEMNLTYNTENIHAAVTVNYQYRTGTIETKSFNSKAFPSGVPSGVWEMIRNGELTLDDTVAVNTSFFSERTDWFLLYSLSQKQYVQYEEMTFAMAYGWLNPGGTSKHLYYSDGRLSGSFYEKCTDKAELTMTFDPYGTLVHASILQFGPEWKSYPYDESTGLFDGKKISELDLGFEEADVLMKAPAALEKEPAEREMETAALKAVEAPVIAEYTSVSKIPMAVDFTVSMEFDDAGIPHIVTDYPFDATGATEMNLTYNTENIHAAVTVNYQYRTGTIETKSFNSKAFPSGVPSGVWEMIRNGELTLDDTVAVNTSFFSERTDWFLLYSLSQKQYVQYEEMTFAMAYGWLNPGGTSKHLYYSDGRLSGSFYEKCTDKAELTMTFDPYGTLVHASILQFGPEWKSYPYDESTGLFDGKKISELDLGFEEADVLMKAPAALEKEPAEREMETAALKAVEAPVIAEYTSVSKIPMAVDFTVSVEFDDEGQPHIVTDYPFEATGATEMILQYNKKLYRYAVVLTYDPATGKTRCGGYYSQDFLGTNEKPAQGSEMIRTGELTLDDKIWIGTTNHNEQTGWYLEYSIREKNYVTYKEKTQSEGFNVMGAGGEMRQISYDNGMISGSHYTKRTENADLSLLFDKYGDVKKGYVSQNQRGGKSYDYDPVSGLFAGKKISELGLGFEEADLQVNAPAALGKEPAETKTEAAAARIKEASAEETEQVKTETEAGASAAEEEKTANPKLFQYKVKEDETAEITSVSEMITDGRIPAELDGYAVTSIGKRAFQNCNKLSEAVIPEGVTTIGEWAFYCCDKLKTISIPDSVQEIEQVPFLQCNNLETITISPNHPVYAFSNHALISKKDMKLIAACGMGAQYEVSWGITEIGEDAFCSGKLKSVILPDSVQKIGMCAFTGAYNLEEAFIPEGVKVIETQAFMHCRKLKSVTIPDSVYRIGFGLFNDCNMLATVEISENHPVYEVKDLVLIDKRTKEIISSAGRIEGVYTVPEGIQSIATVAFQECDFMTEIIIPDSVTEIGHGALPEFNNLICRGGEGSCAQEYCKQNGITFEVMKNEE